MTGTVALIGFPLKHTVSPVFQQAALDHAGLKVRYEAREIPPGELKAEVSRMRRRGCLGANVTVPYKEAVIPLLDVLDPVSSQIGAVNTIVSREGRLTGYNTDISGFELALVTEAHFDARDRKALVIGAGGSARAIILALIRAGAGSITVANRTFERAQSLVTQVWQTAGQAGFHTALSAIGLEGQAMHRALASSQLVVNCTTVGMNGGPGEGQSPLAGFKLPARILVCDLVYNPLVTPLLQQATESGAVTMGGVAMLVFQGAAAFKLWTGLEAPVGIMREAAYKALNESSGGD